MLEAIRLLAADGRPGLADEEVTLDEVVELATDDRLSPISSIAPDQNTRPATAARRNTVRSVSGRRSILAEIIAWTVWGIPSDSRRTRAASAPSPR